MRFELLLLLRRRAEERHFGALPREHQLLEAPEACGEICHVTHDEGLLLQHQCPLVSHLLASVARGTKVFGYVGEEGADTIPHNG